jgi:hypothetical protein
VYKRPFVDYFLRKVRHFAESGFISLTAINLGLWMVYISYIYCLYARIRGSCDRLARCWSRNP